MAHPHKKDNHGGELAEDGKQLTRLFNDLREQKGKCRITGRAEAPPALARLLGFRAGTVS